MKKAFYLSLILILFVTGCQSQANTSCSNDHPLKYSTFPFRFSTADEQGKLIDRQIEFGPYLDVRAFINTCPDYNKMAGLTCLEVIYIDANQCPDISNIYKFRNLKYVYIYPTLVVRSLMDVEARIDQLQSITGVESIGKLRKLEQLEIRQAELPDISFLQNLKTLKVLSLTGNGVSDISPIADLTALEVLDLGGTQINDFTPLKKLVNLRYLNLDDTNFRNTSVLQGLNNLEYLRLTNTFVSWEDCQSLKNKLGNNSVLCISPEECEQIIQIRKNSSATPSEMNNRCEFELMRKS
jgi:Leucine-rich repeat (LRR) protein